MQFPGHHWHLNAPLPRQNLLQHRVHEGRKVLQLLRPQPSPDLQKAGVDAGAFPGQLPEICFEQCGLPGNETPYFTLVGPGVAGKVLVLGGVEVELF